jgi:hypothetical protein
VLIVASIHVTEIQRLLAARGQADAVPWGPDGYFLEIRFDRPGVPTGVVDPEFRDRVITADSAFGSVIIQFDEEGQLRSIDLS